MKNDFVSLYHEEGHLFRVIGPRFRNQGWLNAYDLFFIVRWKANRAITKTARRLVEVSGRNLDSSSRLLTTEVYNGADPRARFVAVYGRWGLNLPIASAILTVLYPEDFTVYDVRACDQLNDFHVLASRAKPETRWPQYLRFKSAVEQATPQDLSLRDKDRYLWSKSRHESLSSFIRRDFR